VDWVRILRVEEIFSICDRTVFVQFGADPSLLIILGEKLFHQDVNPLVNLSFLCGGVAEFLGLCELRVTRVKLKVKVNRFVEGGSFDTGTTNLVNIVSLPLERLGGGAPPAIRNMVLKLAAGFLALNERVVHREQTFSMS